MSSQTLVALRQRPSRLTRLWRVLTRRIELHRSRRALLLLDDHLLRDVGLSRSEAEAEAARRDWDAPPHWRA